MGDIEYNNNLDDIINLFSLVKKSIKETKKDIKLLERLINKNKNKNNTSSN